MFGLKGLAVRTYHLGLMAYMNNEGGDDSAVAGSLRNMFLLE